MTHNPEGGTCTMKRILIIVAAVAALTVPGAALASAPSVRHALSPAAVQTRMQTYLNRTTFAAPNPSVVVAVNCAAQTFPGVTGQSFLCFAHLGYRSGASTVQSQGQPWQVAVVKNGNLRYAPLTVGCLPPHTCDLTSPDMNVGGPLTSG